MSGSRVGKILTLDLATELGWTLGRPGEEPRWGVFRLPKTGKDAGAFGAAFHRWLYPFLKEELPEVVVFEAPLIGGFGHSNFATKYKLQGLCFYTEALCRLMNIRVYQVDAGTWKSAIIGTNRFNKQTRPYPPIEACAQRGFSITNDNAADALCLWLYALGVLDERAAAMFDPLARRCVLA